MTQVVVSPANRDVVLAVHRERIERSTDGGRTWLASLAQPSYSSVAWSGSRAWAVGSAGTAPPAAYTSLDGGLTFVAATALPTTSTSPGQVGADAGDDRHATVAVPDGAGGVVATTFDAGVTWTAAAIPSAPYLGGARRVAIDPTDGTRVWVAFDRVLMSSTDSGRTFVPSTAPVTTMTLNDVAAIGSLIYVSTYHRLVVSEDSGATWSERPLDSPTIFPYAVAVHPATPATVLALAQDGVHRSTDAGRSFTLLHPPQRYVRSGSVIAIAPSDPSTIYIERERSTDAGASWTELGLFDFAPRTPLSGL